MLDTAQRLTRRSGWMSKIIAFPDTNVLLRAQALKQIDWKVALGANDVELVVARVVVDELDRKKYDPKLQERARKANAQLQEIHEAGGTVADGVRLVVAYGELDAGELKSHGLLWDHGDDRLLGCALKYLSGDLTNIVIVSMDNGLLNRAPTLGFKTWRLPEKYRLPVGQDQEAEKLRARIKELEEPFPDLALVFATGETRELAAIPIQGEGDIALGYVREWTQADPLVAAGIPGLDARGMFSAHAANDSAAFWEFARQQEAAEHVVARCKGVRFRLHNKGRHPARGVRVWIDLPEEAIEAVSPRIEFPKEPTLRTSPIVGQPAMVTYMPKFRARPIRMTGPDKTGTPGVAGPQRTEQAATIAFRMEGGIEDLGYAVFPEFHLLFKAGDLPESVKLSYKIVASGVPKDFEGELTIDIRRTPPVATVS
jgi:hypothetical protein